MNKGGPWAPCLATLQSNNQAVAGSAFGLSLLRAG